MRVPFPRLVGSVACLIAATLLAPSREARADLLYNYVFDTAVYEVDPGATVDVRVSLLETVNGGSTSLLATEGLIGAGVRVAFDNVPMPSDAAMVKSLADIFPNIVQFDDPAGVDTDLVAGSSAGLVESVQIVSPAVFGTPVGANQFIIELGVFRFTAGNVAGETTFITAFDRSPADETVTGTTFTVLDGLINTGSAQIHVRSVPEPSSILLMAIATPGAAWWIVARKRRRSGRGERSARIGS